MRTRDAWNGKDHNHRARGIPSGLSGTSRSRVLLHSFCSGQRSPQAGRHGQKRYFARREGG